MRLIASNHTIAAMMDQPDVRTPLIPLSREDLEIVDRALEEAFEKIKKVPTVRLVFVISSHAYIDDYFRFFSRVVVSHPEASLVDREHGRRYFFTNEQGNCISVELKVGPHPHEDDLKCLEPNPETPEGTPTKPEEKNVVYDLRTPEETKPPAAKSTPFNNKENSNTKPYTPMFEPSPIPSEYRLDHFERVLEQQDAILKEQQAKFEEQLALANMRRAEAEAVYAKPFGTAQEDSDDSDYEPEATKQEAEKPATDAKKPAKKVVVKEEVLSSSESDFEDATGQGMSQFTAGTPAQKKAVKKGSKPFVPPRSERPKRNTRANPRYN